jgi:3-methyladenine DNA glycosylase AlkD
MLATLKDSLYPSQREWAAEQLSELNVRGQPQVVQSLTKYAKEDPAATVRAACVHALAHMKANTTEVTAVVQELKNDRDPRVRQEADEALNAIGVTAAVHQDSAVQPASHR